MTTVRDLLDDLVDGRILLSDVTTQFASRKWNTPHQDKLTEFDVPEPDPNSWDVVSVDSRLTPEQYKKLADAYVSTLTENDLTAGLFGKKKGFDPNEPRDEHGRWTRSPHPSDKWDNALTGKSARYESGARGTLDVAQEHNDPSLQDAAEYYQTHPSWVNTPLRHGKDAGQPDEGHTDAVHGLDKMMSESSLDHDVVAYRGIYNPRDITYDNGVWNANADNTGLTWTDKAYVSTSIEHTAPEDLAKQQQSVVMRVHVPKGTHVLRMESQHEHMQWDLELLLDRGLTFRIIKDHQDKRVTPAGKSHSVRHIDVEVVPKDLTAGFDPHEPRDSHGRWTDKISSKIKDLVHGSDKHAEQKEKIKQLADEELARQEKLTPKSRKRLGSIFIDSMKSKYGKDFFSKVDQTHAAYYTYGTNDEPEHDIYLSPVFVDKPELMRAAFRDAKHLGLVAKSERLGVPSVVAHEYGHHLDRILTNGTGNYSAEIGDQLFPALAEAFKTKGRAGKTGQPVTEKEFGQWLKVYNDYVYTYLSGRAAHDQYELMAEIWSEYSSGGDQARPHIVKLGKLMQQLVESVA